MINRIGNFLIPFRKSLWVIIIFFTAEQSEVCNIFLGDNVAIPRSLISLFLIRTSSCDTSNTSIRSSNLEKLESAYWNVLLCCEICFYVLDFENKLFCNVKSVIALSDGFFHQANTASELVNSYTLFNSCIHSLTKFLDMYLLHFRYACFVIKFNHFCLS